VIPTARAAQLTMNREGHPPPGRRGAGPAHLALSFCRFPGRIAGGHRRTTAALATRASIKPVMSSSGKGQSLVRKGPADVQPRGTIRRPADASVPGRVIVEGFIDFDYEITQLTVRACRMASGTVQTYFCDPIGHVQVNGDYVESWQPHGHEPGWRWIARAPSPAPSPPTWAGAGCFGVELFVKGDQVWFSEVSPRPHDTGLVTLAPSASPNLNCMPAPSSACRWM
jgi:phosphoribosylglycinamide formyltransferase 2